jgi:nitrite reductase (NADH) small subunit
MTRVCSTRDVPLGEGRVVTIGGRRVAVFHTPDGWYALDHGCPHKGGPLADGILADACVVCPLHDRRYDLRTGAAIDGGEPVAAHPVQVRGDDVLVAVAAPLARAA